MKENTKKIWKLRKLPEGPQYLRVSEREREKKKNAWYFTKIHIKFSLSLWNNDMDSKVTWDLEWVREWDIIRERKARERERVSGGGGERKGAGWEACFIVDVERKQ